MGRAPGRLPGSTTVAAPAVLAFDVIGAQAAGVPAAWVNRSGAPFDPIADPPAIVVRSLGELSESLTGR